MKITYNDYLVKIKLGEYIKRYLEGKKGILTVIGLGEERVLNQSTGILVSRMLVEKNLDNTGIVTATNLENANGKYRLDGQKDIILETRVVEERTNIIDLTETDEGLLITVEVEEDVGIEEIYSRAKILSDILGSI